MQINHDRSFELTKNKKTILRLLKYAKKYIFFITIALIIILITIGIELYQPILMGNVVDTFLEKSETNFILSEHELINRVIKLSVIYFLTVLFVFILSYIQALILAFMGQKIIYNIRMDVFKHINTLSMDYFNNTPIGKVVTRVTNDTESLNEMYTSVITNSLKSCFMLIGIIITMISYNLQLSLLTFTIIPFIVVFTIIFQKVSKKIYKRIRSKISSLNAFISEHISGMKLVQIFAVEKEIFEKFKNENNNLKNDHIKQLFSFAFYNPISYVLSIIAIVILLWYGGKMSIDKTITIGMIVAFQRYVNKFFTPIQELAEQLNVLQSAMAAAERIFDLLDMKSSINESQKAIELCDIKGDIEFRNVWFAYNEGEWILKNVSFNITAGQKVAFVGATGAGKTTIQNLICRYFDIQSGEILIDGVNIKNIKISSLRKNIGQMLQDVFIFTGNVKDNIRLKEKDITDDEIIEAAKYVNADKFIENLPNKYDEMIPERGSSLSSGQRQLISFARTLAFKPSVLILDEATANIDTETEILIQEGLNNLMTGRTTLIVAHRLSTIQNADKIIVMHKGEIREEGTHQELLANKNIYYKLYKLQYERVEEIV